MSDFLYDPWDLRYKSPFGAVQTDQKIRFNITVSPQNMLSIRLVYHAPDFWESTCMYSTDGENYSCEIELSHPNIYLYHFEIDTPNSIIYIGSHEGKAATGHELAEWQLTVYSKEFETPHWIKGGIMYHIFPDRFCRDEGYHLPPARNTRIVRADWNGVPQSVHTTPNYKANDFFCGNISGIISKLDYLKSLGINMIYFNPIFESAENHRYSTGDYMKIDPYFGSEQDFAKLAHSCEKNNISLLLDGVFSHTGADSLYFNRYGSYGTGGAFNDPASPYSQWFRFSESPYRYECWWGFENLPNVDETNPEYMNFVDKVLEHWQKKGVRGWRLDVVDELPDIFIDRLRTQIKNNDPDAFLIGEVWEDASNKESYGIKRRYLLGDQLDSVMNYPWRTAIIDFVMHGDAHLFKNRIMTITENYPRPVLNCLMNILSTHDTVRIVNVLGVEHAVPQHEKEHYRLSDQEYALGKEREKAAVFLQFTLPGIPSVYYGDEVGLQGFEDPYCRMCYPYGNEDNDLLDFYTALADVRTAYKNDFSDDFKLLFAQESAFAFERGSLVCAINLGDSDITLPLFAEPVYSIGNISASLNQPVIKPKSFGIFKKRTKI